MTLLKFIWLCLEGVGKIVLWPLAIIVLLIAYLVLVVIEKTLETWYRAKGVKTHSSYYVN